MSIAMVKTQLESLFDVSHPVEGPGTQLDRAPVYKVSIFSEKMNRYYKISFSIHSFKLAISDLIHSFLSVTVDSR